MCIFLGGGGGGGGGEPVIFMSAVIVDIISLCHLKKTPFEFESHMDLLSLYLGGPVLYYFTFVYRLYHLGCRRKDLYYPSCLCG